MVPKARCIPLGWLLAAVGWSLFLASYVGFLETQPRRLATSDVSCENQTGNETEGGVEHGANEHTAGHDAHGHPHDALAFLLLSFIFGVSLTALTMVEYFKGLQQTVALFISGIILALIHNAVPAESMNAVWASSWEMWMNIDPHLLLFTMLPALLMADAMTINTGVAQRVAKQCLYLAGPGVIANTLMVAGFLHLYLPYQWPFFLCLTAGAILSATDPVAVVALLKELGASPTLTVLIQGEALLNDGTSIVMYLISYNMLKGVTYDSYSATVFLTRTITVAVAAGVLIGVAAYLLLKKVGSPFDHNSGIIQTVLTLGCAYVSFYSSEGLFSASGVLSTVAAALVLARKMWPVIIDRESLMSFWHVFEYLCNTLIFFLAGALTGNSMINIEAQDWGHLLVIYIFLVLARGSIVFCSMPLLQLMHPARQKVTVQEALVITWGGLRGAVGLSLAIQVAKDRAGGVLSYEDAHRVLFYVGGVAALTLVVNATTSPLLVSVLGITRWESAKQSMMLMLHSRLKVEAKHLGTNSQVTHTLSHVLGDLKHEIKKQKIGEEDEVQEVEIVHSKSNVLQGHETRLRRSRASRFTEDVVHGLRKLGEKVTLTAGVDNVNDWQEGKAKTEEMRRQLLKSQQDHSCDAGFAVTILDLLDDLPMQNDMPHIHHVVEKDNVWPPMLRVLNEAFLKIVESEYWELIEKRHFPDTETGEALLLSVSMARETPPHELKDLERLQDLIKEKEDEYHGQISRRNLHETSSLQRLCNSLPFTIFMTIVIVLSVAVVQYEDIAAVSYKNMVVIVLEAIFLTIFFVEMVLKLTAFRLKYFWDSWNVLDFVLLCTGVAGLISQIDSLRLDDLSEMSAESRLLRTTGTLRILRLFRVFRLFRLTVLVRRKLRRRGVSADMAQHLHTMALLEGFVLGHLKAQTSMVRFFCRGTLDNDEICRVILQSQIQVFCAMQAAVEEESRLGIVVRRNVSNMRESINAVRELEHFVLDARKIGLLNATDTESLLHPLHEHMAHIRKKFYRCFNGDTGFEDKEDETDEEHERVNSETASEVSEVFKSEREREERKEESAVRIRSEAEAKGDEREEMIAEERAEEMVVEEAKNEDRAAKEVPVTHEPPALPEAKSEDRAAKEVPVTHEPPALPEDRAERKAAEAPEGAVPGAEEQAREDHELEVLPGRPMLG
ncbi:unnamed protein product [Effrenium voratum]|uniref:Na+/H+ antiporter n=1 Tax=Effrenium voratum TaxID=2562239 RepID=A0AA36IVQ7_9DINO|nr:unnamed protein product [Effrenium voratum]CAJ1430083.1 unnamed protein product [Effrenium voratum]